jgi:hypothetical protein
MNISVRIEYRSTMGEVGRVLRAMQRELGDQAVVWGEERRHD